VTDVVIASLEPWDEVWRRNQHLVAGLLRTDPRVRVLFVEPAPDPLHAVLSGRRPRRGRGLRPGPTLPGMSGDRMWLLEPTKWLPRRVDAHVDSRVAERVVAAATHIGLHDPVLWINDPAGATLLERTGWPALYDITDDWLAARRSEAEHARLVQHETYLLANCREVVVCSPHLAETKSARVPVTLVQNAVDTEAYRVQHARPGDLPAGPAAVYVGTVHRDRMDVDLCVATARASAGVGRLVLVGPDLLGREDRQRLTEAGVLLTGPRPFTEVPAYLQHARVLVVPHVVDDFTDSLDPIKVYEYRAARRPVVSTPVAGFREQAGRNAVTVASGEAFAAAVREALASEAEPAVPIDGVPTWSDRVAQVRNVLDRLGASS
jgi:glycosyltransferase involved in cell wall biosynthesis